MTETTLIWIVCGLGVAILLFVVTVLIATYRFFKDMEKERQ